MTRRQLQKSLQLLDFPTKDNPVLEHLISQGDARFFELRSIELIGSLQALRDRISSAKQAEKAQLQESHDKTYQLALLYLAISHNKHATPEPKAKARPRSKDSGSPGDVSQGEGLGSTGDSR